MRSHGPRRGPARPRRSLCSSRISGASCAGATVRRCSRRSASPSGVGLVVAVTAYADGVAEAQDEVLHSLYGVGTDITVTQAAEFGSGGPARIGMDPGDSDRQGEEFSRDRVMSAPGQKSSRPGRSTPFEALDGVSAAAGGLLAHVMHVEGEFAQIMHRVRAAMAACDDGPARRPNLSASQAPMEITSFSIDRGRRDRPDARSA